MTARGFFMGVLLSLFLFQQSQAGFERREHGARQIGMGGTFVGIADNAWATIYNPSGLGQLRTGEISAFYSPQPFGLRELSLGSVAVVQPTSLETFGISGSRFGFELYREISGSFSYANSYSDIFFFGVNVTYNSLAIKKYGSASAVGVDIGVLTRITSELRWGFFAANINAPTIGQAKEKLPQVYSSGLSYMPVAGLLVGVDVLKDLRYSAVVKGGLEYKPVDVVSLRAGVGAIPQDLAPDLAFTTYSFSLITL